MCVCVFLREREKMRKGEEKRGHSKTREDVCTRTLTQCDGIVHVLQCNLDPQPVLPLNCNSMQSATNDDYNNKL